LFSVSYTAEDPSGNVSPTVIRLVKIVLDPNSDIEESALGKIEVYPNPGNGKYFINIENGIGKEAVVNVFNKLGEEILTIEKGMILQGSYEIDLTSFADGVYMLRIQTATESITKRLIKQ